MKKLEDWLTKVSNVFAQSVFLNIVSAAFMMIMPITIIGHLLRCSREWISADIQTWIQSNGLYNLWVLSISSLLDCWHCILSSALHISMPRRRD
jgi:cellobiose-specific phosphotransferase system component IIC